MAYSFKLQRAQVNKKFKEDLYPDKEVYWGQTANDIYRINLALMFDNQ